MEDCHRKVIIDNIDKLIEYTHYMDLMKACVKTNIISSIMMRNIENLDLDEKSKHRALFIKLTKRGPEAYNKIHETLIKLGYRDAAKILRPGEYSGFDKSLKDKSLTATLRRESTSPEKSIYNDGCIHSKDTIDKNNTDEDNNGTNLKIYSKDVPQKFKVIKSNKLYVDGKIEIYSMRTKKNRGVLFMVNIIDFPNAAHSHEKRRNGAEIDRDNMIHLFREFGFTIFYFENKTLDEFHNLLDHLLLSNHVKETECFILSLMTHGTMVDGIERAEFYDGAVENLTNILDKFRNNVCHNLIRKPKIFFFPFCRGSVSDIGAYKFKSRKTIESDGMDVRLPKNIPTYSDMLICYASVPGFKVHRDPDEGSWYIQKLCEVFANNAHDTHIEDLLKMVGDKTEKIRTDDGKLQTASFINYGFHKKLYFNPGYYDS